MSTVDAYGQTVTIAELTDAPNANALAAGIVTPLVPRSNMRFASASARNATITSPVAGMRAFLIDTKLDTLYDGTAWVVAASGTSAWTTPTLASGYTGNGNSNGTPQYRLVNLFGELTVMWKGGINVTYSGGLPANGGNFLSVALPTALRPTAKRTVTAACSAVSSDSLSVKLDFNTTGTTSIVTQGGVTPPWISLNNIMYSL
ncbi:hypothetical protein [Streptomyces sp. NBC_00932]|uniref:hypothetical protein n=1 Tax=Streptomyces sp. NBC_00932 TaxID=2903690 RepID=UPI00386692C8|nr:hypothetical protein OG221_27885 [Streptomyces sp. NBC_00932]